MINALKQNLRESLNQTIGKSKSPKYELPPIDHVYGYKPKADKFSADIVLRDWKVHVKSKPPEKQVDFIGQNIRYVKKKSKNPKKSLEIKNRVNRSQDDIPDISFGLKNRPSTPIADVINFEYSKKAVAERMKRYESFIHKNQHKQRLLPKLNKHFEALIRLRKEKENKEKEIPKDFRLKMFDNIGPRVKIARSSSVKH